MMSIISAFLFCVGLTAVPPSLATSAIRRGDVETESPLIVDSSLWPFHGGSSDIQTGITFERTETSCPLLPSQEVRTNNDWLLPWSRSPRSLKSSIGMFLTSSILDLFSPARSLQVQQSPSATLNDGHCESSDQFGSNSCHYSWGDDITVAYDARLGGQEFGEDVYVKVSLTIDNLVHHTQTCPVCGDKACTISIASLPQSTWTIDLPKCPVTPDMLVGEWKGKLPPENPIPIPALLSGSEGTFVEGTAWLKKGDFQADDGNVLMEVKGNVHLK